MVGALQADWIHDLAGYLKSKTLVGPSLTQRVGMLLVGPSLTQRVGMLLWVPRLRCGLGCCGRSLAYAAGWDVVAIRSHPSPDGGPPRLPDRQTVEKHIIKWLSRCFEKS